MATSVPADIAAALRYGPKAQQSIRRSQYLSDALKQLGDQGQRPIQGWGELGSKLLATAILNRANDKAQDRTLGAIKEGQDSETASLIAALGGGKPAAPQQPQMPAAPPPPMPTAPAPQPVMSAPLPPAQPQPQQVSASPEDVDALARMLATEAIGEGPEGMAAAGHVALNRLKSGHGGAKTLRDVVFAPNQFEGMSRAGQVKPEDYQKAAQVAQAILSGQVPDPTGGAVNFLNPDLQVQMGRQIPAWAQGPGQRIGRHVFFGGQPQQQAAQGVPPPPMPPNPAGPTVQPAAQPYEVAAIGPTPPPPSAPGSSPSAAGAPAAAPPPQAGAAAGNAPQWPTYQPTADEVGYIEKLLRDPRTHDVGVQEARTLQKKMTQPAEASIEMINGLPFYVSKTPGQGGQPVMIPVPKEALTQIMSAQQAGLASAPQGLNVQRDPLGNVKEAPGAPPAGYNATPQGYAPIQGGPADPYRAQPAPQGYQYQGGGQQPIQGGPADPTSPQNLIAGEGKLRDDYEKQIKDYSLAREGYQKVIAAAKGNTPADSIAMIFGVMKTLDPTSTVREGEYATVQNSGTVDQTVTNLYNKLLAGGAPLTPEQRAQFSDMARRQFEVYQKSADALSERYGGLATSYGFDPSRVVRQFAPIEPFAPTGAGGQFPDPVNRAHQAMVQAGKYDPKAQLGSLQRPILMESDAALKAFDRPENRGKHIITPDGKLGVIE